MKRQQGAITIMVIIVLVAMLFVVAAILRSSESASNTTSTMAFQQAAKSAADVGIYQATQYLLGVSDFDSNVAHKYYALKQNTDSNGIPQGIDWSQASAIQVGNYQVQYVIERMCEGTLPVTDPKAQCIVASDEEGGSKKIGAPVYIDTNKRYYRVTVKVLGPKSTQVYVQSIIAR